MFFLVGEIKQCFFCFFVCFLCVFLNKTIFFFFRATKLTCKIKIITYYLVLYCNFLKLKFLIFQIFNIKTDFLNLLKLLINIY